MAKAKKGGFKDTPLDGLILKILEQVVRKSRLDPQMVEDICVGNVSIILGQNAAAIAYPDIGLRRKGSILLSRRNTCRRLPKHHRRLFREPLLLVWLEGRARYRQPDNQR